MNKKWIRTYLPLCLMASLVFVVVVLCTHVLRDELPDEVPKRYIEFPELPGAYLFDKNEEYYWMLPLNDAEWRTADHADHMRSDDLVFGLYWNDKAWALPWWILKNHHVAKLVLDHQPVLVTFCEVCSSACAFHAVVDGQRYTFRIVGAYNGTHFLADYETGSYWPSFEGNSVYGPRKGSKMERLPLYQCTWKEWLTLQPKSLVAYGADILRTGHGQHFEPGNPRIHPRFRKSLLRPVDHRLPPGELLLGVEVNGKSRAYPLATLDKLGRVLNEKLGGQEIVLLHLPDTMMAIAFSRQIGDNVLIFKQGDDGQILDQKYHGRWNYNGEAIEGTLAGQKLCFVSSKVEEWYIWAAFHPKTDIFEPDISTALPTGPEAWLAPPYARRRAAGPNAPNSD